MSENDNTKKEAIKIAESTQKVLEKMTKPAIKFGEQLRDVAEQFSKSAMTDMFDKFTSQANYLRELSIPTVDYTFEIPTQEETNYYQSGLRDAPSYVDMSTCSC